MNWLRAKLREWLCPELLKVSILLKETNNSINSIKKETCELQNVLERQIKDGKEMLVSDINILLGSIKNREREFADLVSSDLGAMFFKFQGRKMVAVKDVLRLLLDYFQLELVVRKMKNRELKPRIRERQKNRKTLNPAI